VLIVRVVLRSKGGKLLTGCQHDHFRWEMQIDVHHLGDCRCDESGEAMHCAHARNEEPRLRVEDRVSFEYFK